MDYVQISATVLFFNSNILTWIAVKQLYSWIYLYHSPTDLHYLRRHMQINYLPAGGAVGVVENWGFSVTLYTKQSSAHKRCFRHYMQD